MTRYVALLRAVNVGGTGKLPMADLKILCGQAGFTRVETYIASGNVVFECEAAATEVKAALEVSLEAHMGKPIAVMVRTAIEMAAVIAANPFKLTAPNRTYAIFLDSSPPRDAADHATGQTVEIIGLGDREIFVHYPAGIGRSKLKIPAARTGTARNMNTVAKLSEIAARR